MFLDNSWFNPWAAPSLRTESYMNYGLHAGTNFVEKADSIDNKYGKVTARVCAYAVDFFTCLFANPTALFYNSTIGLVRNASIRRSNRITLEKTHSSWKPTSYKPILTLASIALTLFLAHKGLNAFLSTTPHPRINPNLTPPAFSQRPIPSSFNVTNPSFLGKVFFPDTRDVIMTDLALLTIAIPVGLFYRWKTNTVGRQAIAFALEKLEQNREAFHPHANESALHPPVNPKITHLRNLLDDTVFPPFLKALAQFQDRESGENKRALLVASDELIQVSYAVSCLTLKDLPDFRKRHKEQTGEDLTYAQILTRPDFAAYWNFFICTSWYHFIRRGYCDTPDPQPEKDSPSEEGFQIFSGFFYRENASFPHTWNRLYNDYCQSRSELASDDELKDAGGQLHVDWTQKDTKETEATFIKYLGPHPTYSSYIVSHPPSS